MSVGLSPFGAASGRLFFRRRSRRGTRRRKTHHAVARVALELSNWGSKTLKSEGVGGALSAFGGGGPGERFGQESRQYLPRIVELGSWRWRVRRARSVLQKQEPDDGRRAQAEYGDCNPF
jgi:hypothetical protein